MERHFAIVRHALLLAEVTPVEGDEKDSDANMADKTDHDHNPGAKLDGEDAADSWDVVGHHPEVELGTQGSTQN